MATLVDLIQLSFDLDLDLRADVIRTQRRQGSKKATAKAKFGLPKNVGKHFLRTFQSDDGAGHTEESA